MEQAACNSLPGCLHLGGDCHLPCVRILTQVNVAGYLLVYSSCIDRAVIEMPFARISHQSPHVGKRSFYHSCSQKSMPCCWREDFVVHLYLFLCTLIPVRGKQKVFAHKRARYRERPLLTQTCHELTSTQLLLGMCRGSSGCESMLPLP